MNSLIDGLVIAFFLSTVVALARSSLRAGAAREIERKHRRFFEESLAGAVEAQLRQTEKADAIGRLAGGVAHDFNNLLSVITGHAELLERDLAPEHQGRRRLREIRRAVDSATILTRQLLALSRRDVDEARVLARNEIVPDPETASRAGASSPGRETPTR